MFRDFVELCGDRLYGNDTSIIGGIAEYDGVPVTVIGQIRGNTLEENIKFNFSMSKPEGYRKALRLMKQAEKFHHPVICFVDTLGAYPGEEAEERGQGSAIANCLMESLNLQTVIISVLIGNGGSGGALAFCVADKIFALENAMLGVISPKACSNILWKDFSREAEAAELLKMTADHLERYGIIDGIIPEPPGGSQVNPQLTAKEVDKVISASMFQLMKVPVKKLVKERIFKFQTIGREYLS